MKFPSSIWQIQRHGPPGFLFVDADSGRMVPVQYHDPSRYVGFGLWYHDFGDYEIVTTHIKKSGINLWLHEYYRIDGDFMQWSNFGSNIMHGRVCESEVPPNCMKEIARILDVSANRELPDYDPENLRGESVMS